jgi:hypothetical protein
MSNLNKELDDIFNSVDLPSDSDVKRDTLSLLHKINGKSLSNNPNWLESNRKARKLQGEDQEYRESVSNGVKKKYEDKEWRDAQKKRKQDLFSTEGYKQKRLLGIKKKFEDPEFRQRHSNGGSKRVGAGNGRYQGVKVGTCITTGKQVRCVSNQDLKNLGFSQSKVSECINGNRKHHKGYMWTLEKK